MPSGIDTDSMSPMAPIGTWTIPAAADDATTGAIKKPTTARIESRREISDQSFTHTPCHVE